MARSEPQKLERIAVIGAGTISASWAAYFLSRGPAVRVRQQQELDAAIWRPARGAVRVKLFGGVSRGGASGRPYRGRRVIETGGKSSIRSDQALTQAGSLSAQKGAHSAPSL